MSQNNTLFITLISILFMGVSMVGCSSSEPNPPPPENIVAADPTAAVKLHFSSADVKTPTATPSAVYIVNISHESSVIFQKHSFASAQGVPAELTLNLSLKGASLVRILGYYNTSDEVGSVALYYGALNIPVVSEGLEVTFGVGLIDMVPLRSFSGVIHDNGMTYPGVTGSGLLYFTPPSVLAESMIIDNPNVINGTANLTFFGDFPLSLTAKGSALFTNKTIDEIN